MSDVFISYSRPDIDFVRHLFDQLIARDRDAWADWQDIPPTADCSPDSVASEILHLHITVFLVYIHSKLFWMKARLRALRQTVILIISTTEFRITTVDQF